MYGPQGADNALAPIDRNPGAHVTGFDNLFTRQQHGDAVGYVLPWLADGVTTVNISDLPVDTEIVETTCAQCAVGITMGADGQVQVHHLNAIAENDDIDTQLTDTDANYDTLMDQIGGDADHTWLNARRLQAITGDGALNHPIDVNQPVHV